MSKGKGNKNTSIQRGASDSTKRTRLLNDLAKYPDYKPIFIPSPLQADLDLVKDQLPLDIKDRRFKAPRRQVGRNKYAPPSINRPAVVGGVVFGQNSRLIRFLVCTRRKIRKSVILSKFMHKKGGMGKARKDFRSPIQKWESKIKC